MSVLPELSLVLQGTLALLLGALMGHFKKNRRYGLKRDEALEANTSTVSTMSSKVEELTKEITQDRIATKVMEQRVAGMERELSYLRSETHYSRKRDDNG